MNGFGPLFGMLADRIEALLADKGYDAGRRAWAANTVPSPEGAGTVRQRFTFSGAITDHAVRWPARIEIAQDGKPFFDLRLSGFRADAA